jgi:hypothetical protein
MHPLVLYCCREWSFTSLKIGHKMQVFQNFLENIYTYKDDKSEWFRIWQGSSFFVLLCSVIMIVKSRNLIMGWSCSSDGGDKKYVKNFDGNILRKWLLGRQKGDIKMNFKKLGCEGNSSGPCPLTDFGSRSANSLGSSTRDLVVIVVIIILADL